MNVSHLRLVINAKIKENKKKADERNKKRREPKIVPLVPDEDNYRYIPKETDSCLDAETGESISIANSRWNAKEGRLNLNTKTILAMGTGQLDIKARAPQRRKKAASKNNSSSSSSSSTTSFPVIGSASPNPRDNPLKSHSHSQYSSYAPGSAQSIGSDASVGSINSFNSFNSCGGSGTASFSTTVAEKRRHPVISKFLEIGPLYKPFHEHWNSKSNAIEIEDADTLKEEGVEFPDEWDDTDTINSTAVGGERRRDDDDGLDDFDEDNIIEGGASRARAGGSRGGGGQRPTTGTSTIISSPPGSRASGSRIGGASRGSQKSSIVPRRPPKTHLNPNIAAHNRKHWNAVEEKNFDELFSVVSQMEHNKTLTKEKKSNEGMDEVERTCRALAKIKTRGMRELVQAVDDEHEKEAKRQAEASQHVNHAGKTKELLKTHRDQRNAAKQYLTALQTDNEIIFMNKMFEAGFLW